MRTAPFAAVVAAMCIAATPASAASARFFGVVYDRDVSEAPAATQDQQFALMKKTGVETVRRVFSFPWRSHRRRVSTRTPSTEAASPMR